MTVTAPERPRIRRVGDDPSFPAPVPTTATAVPAPNPAGRPRRTHLRSVEPPRRRRSATVPAIVAIGIVFAALLALAVMHALLIGGQLRLDDMHREADAEAEQIRRLQLRVSELESPARVLDAARVRLGMVEPDEVGYLVSVEVDPGDGRTIRVPAATPAPEPEPEPELEPEPEAEATSASAEGTDEVDDGLPSASVPLADDRPSEGGRDE